MSSQPLHKVNQRSIVAPFPADDFGACASSIIFGMGCFWGAERLFWRMKAVYVTSVGYAGGAKANPDYYQVCSGSSGHAEVVQVVYYPNQLDLLLLLQTFWNNHNPTQGNRQGNDRGSQYRSAIFCSNQQDLAAALKSKQQYQALLTERGFGDITTEIKLDSTYYLAEDYHQQYLHTHPNGYCNAQSLDKTGHPRCFL